MVGRASAMVIGHCTMLGRSLTWVGLCCLALCACGKPKNKTSPESMCSDDGGCADAEVESSEAAAGSGSEAAAGSGTRRTRVQAASGSSDAGAAGRAAEDAATARPARTPTPARDAGTARAGSPAPMMDMDTEPEPEEPTEPADAGAAMPSGDACDEQSCGPCEACSESGSCEPVTGQDDADSCGDARSCSSKGMCLHVSESHTDLGTMTDYAELTTSYAQVINFSEPASIVEIRLEVSCNENDQTFPAVWLAEAPGGIPSSTIIATANVLSQSPSDTNTFALLELSKVVEQPETGPIAIVVSRSDMSCIVRLNREQPYENGALFSQGAADLWLPAEGSMVFQVLSSQ